MPTPYDGRIGMVQWTGKAVGESTIEELGATVRQFGGPAAASVWVKTSDGAAWQGAFDTKPALAIDRPESVSRWVEALEGRGLEFHAWCVLRGRDIRAEALRVIEVCNVAGVRSMVLDVEDGPEYFRGGAQDARDLITAIRRDLPSDFHLGLNLDARGQHPKSIFVDEWIPYVQSLHPMVYHQDFGLDPETAMARAFQVLAPFNLPIVPMLQGYGGVPPSEITRAGMAAIRLGAAGLSVFRLGAVGPREFDALRAIGIPGAPGTTDGAASRADPNPIADGAVVVKPGDPGYSDGYYDEQLTPAEAWKSFSDVHGWPVKWKLTSEYDRVYVGYMPRLPAPGHYAVEAFIPSVNADTRSARYFVVYYDPDGTRRERTVTVDQSIYFNEWASLGRFPLDQSVGEHDAGRVNLTDYSIEDPPRRIAVGAVRWRPVSDSASPEGMADGFDAPLGTPDERALDQIWPGHWTDANGYLRMYLDSAGNQAYHTGADLNLNYPVFNADRGAPVQAVASGRVTWAGRLGDYWLNVIVIEHDPLPDGSKVFARYAHVQNLGVAIGDRVSRGQQIAQVGASGGPYGNYHLHFDISPTEILRARPSYWPGTDLEAARIHFLDPREFIIKHRPLPERSR